MHLQLPMELNTEIITTPPLDAATVILLRDSAEGLQVLLMRRHQASNVLGGAYVFPGGKLDAADHHPELIARLSQSPAQMQQRLNEPELAPERAAALFMAAIREAFEESGVLLCQSAAGADTAQVSALQQALAQGQSWGAALQSLALQVQAEALVPWSRWITPRQASVTNKRFDTRFFVSHVPEDQIAQHDNHETTDSVWISPAAALGRYVAGEIELAPPQIMSLVHLKQHANARSVVAEAQLRKPPVIQPEPFDQEGTRVICYPGDPRHSVAERAMPGPSRLRFTGGRFEPEAGIAHLLD
jgi:8-oxo-dGTP pyrophosphatase MutT (NUDIX family)